MQYIHIISVQSARLYYFLLGVGGVVVFLLAVACQPAPAEPVKDGCMSCHEGIEEVSASHPMDRFACVTCHRGDQTTLDKELAHEGMLGGRNPSDLAVVDEACGNCHADHIHRVETSVQSTYAGAIAQVSYAFGQQDGLTAVYGAIAVEDDEITTETGVPSLELFQPAADAATPIHDFTENCLDCHLSAEPISEPAYYRSTGCSSCHMIYANDGLYQGDDPTIDRTEPGHAITHSMTTAIPYYQCNHCHNRGNFSMRDMEFHPREDEPSTRFESYYQPIGQFTQCEWVLDCVDCHTREEVMGDGDIHSNQKEAQYVRCFTCHGTVDEPPLTQTITDPDDIALKMAILNPVIELNVGDTIVVTERGEPMWNIRELEDGSLQLVGKVTKLALPVVRVMDTACEQKADEQESHYCHECHAVEH